jgi:hypothetical protein
MGPILSFRGILEENDARVWQVTLLIVFEGAGASPVLTLDGKKAPPPVELHRFDGKRVLRYDASVAMADKEARVAYELGTETTWWFTVPARDVVPRIAYVSCNGFSNPDGMRKLVKEANAMWADLLNNHDKRYRGTDYVLDREQRWHETESHDKELQRFHLLVMGGDQIYFDSIWEEIEALKGWVSLSRDDQLKFTVDPALAKEIEQYYFGLYVKRWSLGKDRVWGDNTFAHKNAAAAMASIPTIMMWDDHDIFDGWGSYSPAMQDSPLFKFLFDRARQAFWVFQLQHPLKPLPKLVEQNVGKAGTHLDPDFKPVDWRTLLKDDKRALPLLPNQPGFSSAYVLGLVAILALDLRTERSRTQIMGNATWDSLTGVLRDVNALNGRGVQHLVVLSSVPVAHPKISLAEGLLDAFGSDHVTDSNADDINDHWSHDRHDGERKRLIRTLIRTATEQELRVTLVSGDVHVAGWGTIYRKDTTSANNWLRINQFTSSAIIHPSLTGLFERLFLRVMNRTAMEPQPIDTEHSIEMMLFPETSDRVYAARNWLALEPDPLRSDDFQGHRLWATWRCESPDRPTNHLVAVHPYSKSKA